MDQLLARGIRGIPVVTVGDRQVLGFDLAQIDEALGLARNSTARQLSGEELVNRATVLLSAAGRFSLQLPANHYDDPFPGLENAKPPYIQGGRILKLSDGTPYVPHATFIGLVRHIVHHAEKFKHAMEHPDTDVVMDVALWTEFGEADLSLDVPSIVARLNAISEEILRLWRDGAERHLSQVMHTFLGPQTVAQMLQRDVYSLAQHTRQLMTKLLDLGIEPDGPIGAEEYEGLQLPVGVWQ